MISLEWAQNARDGNAAEVFFKVLLLVSDRDVTTPKASLNFRLISYYMLVERHPSSF